MFPYILTSSLLMVDPHGNLSPEAESRAVIFRMTVDPIQIGQLGATSFVLYFVMLTWREELGLSLDSALWSDGTEFRPACFMFLQWFGGLGSGWGSCCENSGPVWAAEAPTGRNPEWAMERPIASQPFSSAAFFGGHLPPAPDLCSLL